MSNETTTAVDKTIAQEERVVVLYATRGAKKEKISTNVTTWGQLKALAKKAGFEVDKLHCTENVGKHDLVHEEAVLPTGTFTVFMRPKETKSGAMDRKELFAAIKEFVGTDKDRKQLFIVDGKNMTQLPTPKLEELYNTHIAGNTSAPATSAKETKSPTKSSKVASTKSNKSDNGVGQVVSDVATSKGEETVNSLLDDIVILTNDNTIISKVDQIRGLLSSSAPISRTAVIEEAKTQLQKEAEEKKAKEEAAEKERLRLEKEEDDRLAAEAKKFM